LKIVFLILFVILFNFASYSNAENISCQKNVKTNNTEKIKTVKYVNSKIGYSIKYPSKTLHPQGESENTNGREFVTEDEEAILIVSGIENELNLTIKEDYDLTLNTETESCPDKNITKKMLRRNYYIIYGSCLDEFLFVKKVILNKNKFKTFYFAYSKKYKLRYEPFVQLFLKSFIG
jgi:hypothetical protein